MKSARAGEQTRRAADRIAARRPAGATDRAAPLIAVRVRQHRDTA